MCRTQENLNFDQEATSVGRMPYPPCEPIKACCLASGRRRPSCVRRNLCPRPSPQWTLEQLDLPPTAPVEEICCNNANKVPCISSQPIEVAKKKLCGSVSTVKALNRMTCTLGVRAGTPEAIALCRGDLTDNIWQYFRSTQTEAALKPNRPSSAPRSQRGQYKSTCIASGRSRASSVVRRQHPCRVPHEDEHSSSDDSAPKSPVVVGSCSWQIRILSERLNEQKVDHQLHLPPILQKDVTDGKLIPPNLKNLGDTPRSRRPSTDTASTADTESHDA